MTDYKSQGLFQRYAFERKDGKPLDAGEEVFQLRFDKDDPWGEACRAALRDFCDRIEKVGYRPLADDLRARITAAEERNMAARSMRPVPPEL